MFKLIKYTEDSKDNLTGLGILATYIAGYRPDIQKYSGSYELIHEDDFEGFQRENSTPFEVVKGFRVYTPDFNKNKKMVEDIKSDNIHKGYTCIYGLVNEDNKNIMIRVNYVPLNYLSDIYSKLPYIEGKAKISYD